MISDLLISFSMMIFVAAPVTTALRDEERLTKVEDELVHVVTSESLLKYNILHVSRHDIVGLSVSHYGADFNNDNNSQDYDNMYLFFVEADLNSNGEKDYKGLYLRKDNTVTKILETATDSDADSKNVYFSATDGLYIYNFESSKPEKFGSITENLISVVKLNSSDTLYVLTADNLVYKVTDHGEKKVKVDEIKYAKQIVLDNSDNLYYYGSDKQPYVLIDGNIKKIEGLPTNPTSVTLFKPAYYEVNDVVPFLSDEWGYRLRADGTSACEYAILRAKPSTLAPDGEDVLYFAYDKMIFKRDLRLPKLIHEPRFLREWSDHAE